MITGWESVSPFIAIVLSCARFFGGGFGIKIQMFEIGKGLPVRAIMLETVQ
jgi:hypothetical protein